MNNLEAQWYLCVFLILTVLKAVENLLKYIFADAKLDLFLNEFQLPHS